MSSRDPRNNRYDMADDRPARGTSPLIRLWRWRMEIIILASAAFSVLTVVSALGKDD